MKIEILNSVVFKNPTNTYEIEVETSTGDGDDYHSFKMYFNKNDSEAMDNFRKALICLDVASQLYPNGKGCDDVYYSIPYFEELGLSDEWFCNEHIVDQDSYENHTVYYYDENGIKFDVDIEFDDEMNKEVSDFMATWNDDDDN